MRIQFSLFSSLEADASKLEQSNSNYRSTIQVVLNSNGLFEQLFVEKLQPRKFSPLGRNVNIM